MVIPEFGVFKFGMLKFGKIELDKFGLGIVFDKFELIILGRLKLGWFKFGMTELAFMVDLGWLMFEMLEFMPWLMLFMILEFILLFMLEFGSVAFGIPS